MPRLLQGNDEDVGSLLLCLRLGVTERHNHECHSCATKDTPPAMLYGGWRTEHRFCGDLNLVPDGITTDFANSPSLALWGLWWGRMWIGFGSRVGPWFRLWRCRR